jgi:hypothetical protein
MRTKLAEGVILFEVIVVASIARAEEVQLKDCRAWVLESADSVLDQ